MTLKRQCTPDLPNLALVIERAEINVETPPGSSGSQRSVQDCRAVLWGAGLPFVRISATPSKTELDSKLVGRGVPVDLPRAFCVWASEVCRIAGSVCGRAAGGVIWLMVTYNY